MNEVPSRVLASSRRVLQQILPGSQGEFPAPVLLFRGEVSSVGAPKGKALVERSQLSRAPCGGMGGNFLVAGDGDVKPGMGSEGARCILPLLCSCFSSPHCSYQHLFT